MGGLMRPKGQKGHCLHMVKHMARGLLALLAILVVTGPVWAAKADLVPVRAALEAGDCDKALSLLQASDGRRATSPARRSICWAAIQLGRKTGRGRAALSEAVNKKRYNEIEALLAYGRALIETRNLPKLRHSSKNRSPRPKTRRKPRPSSTCWVGGDGQRQLLEGSGVAPRWRVSR